jgi:hypothetical protein
MNGFLLIFVAIIYFYVGFDFLFKQNVGFAIAYFAYGTSNIGLWMASK